MAETLLSPSNILLYGRVLEDLEFKAPGMKAPRLGDNNFLLTQLEAGSDKKKDKGPPPTIARIYGLSFEGHYFDLAKPALFVVHGPGKDANDEKPENRYALAPPDTDHTGVAAQGFTFSDDMKVWSYDKGDFSVRLDVETGPLEDILLEMELSGDRLASSYKGMDARIRTSGMDARIRTSGMDARLRGRGGNRGD